VSGLAELQKLVGHPLPGGAYTIEHYRHGLMLDAVGGIARPDGLADPMEAYFGAIGGMGITLDQFYEMVGASADDGPMLGELEIQTLTPLEVGVTYSVRAVIAGVERKQGRQLHAFDIVTLRFELDTGGTTAAVVHAAFIFPRRDA
jgi:hypothetical protein